MPATSKSTQRNTTVVGVFEDRRKAQECVNELRQAGFREDQIGVASRSGETMTGATDVSEKGSNVASGAVAGAATGAAGGALWALGIAAGVLPAIGPVIAGGTLAAMLASAAGGAAVAGLAGALIGLGLSKDDAEYYESEFRSGRTIVTVKAESNYDKAEAIVRRFGAYDRTSGSRTSGAPVAARAECEMPNATAGSRAESTGTVKLHEEQLRVNKQPVQTGEVNVRKEVVTEQKQISVPVEREEVVIERRRVADGKTSTNGIRPEEIRIPVKEEKVNVQKETVVKEEVSVGKRKVQDTQTVGDNLRKEEIRVEEKGNVKVKNK